GRPGVECQPALGLAGLRGVPLVALLGEDGANLALEELDALRVGLGGAEGRRGQQQGTGGEEADESHGPTSAGPINGRVPWRPRQAGGGEGAGANTEECTISAAA